MAHQTDREADPIWHATDVDAALAALGSSARGLASDDALARLQEHAVEDLTSTGQGIRLSLTTTSDQNDPALLLASIAGGGSNAFPLDAANGILMNLVPDDLTLAVASNIGAFINFVDPATGTVTWQQPNWAQLTGLTITWAAAMVDIQTNAVTTYTDPIIQR